MTLILVQYIVYYVAFSLPMGFRLQDFSGPFEEATQIMPAEEVFIIRG